MSIEPSYSDILFGSDGDQSVEVSDQSAETQGNLYSNGSNERNDEEISTYNAESNQTECSGSNQ